MPEQEGEHSFVRDVLPCVLTTMPVDMSSTIIEGIVSKLRSPTQEVWQIIAPSTVEFRSIARLLGMLSLDKQEPVMQSNLMPNRPFLGTLLNNGEMRQGRSKKLASWVLQEINRLAEVFLIHHQSYIADIKGALGGCTNRFRPFPEGFILRDKTGRFRLGPAPPHVEVDTSNSERVRNNLRWDQIILEDYLRNRYMIHLSDHQLNQRIEDILANTLDVGPQGLIILNMEDTQTPYWIARFQEARAEKTIQQGTDVDTWPSGYINLSRLPGSLDNKQLEKRQVLKLSAPLPKLFLIKYAERQHVEDAFNNGHIRVSPASSYRDPSLNAAIKDDELVSEIDFDPGQFSAYYADQIDVPVNKTRRLIRKMDTDYYVYCTASELSTRLLLDFKKDAALVIRDPDEFLKRLDSAMEHRLSNWRSLVKYVQYYDPLQVTPQEIDVLMWKHFRFAYQKEVRVAWLPQEPVQKLKPIFLELGSLSDITEILLPTSVKDLVDRNDLR